MPNKKRTVIADTEFWNEKGKDLLLSRRNIDPRRTSTTSKCKVKVACECCGKPMFRRIDKWLEGATKCQDCKSKERMEKKSEREAREQKNFGKGTLWGDYPWQMIRIWDWKNNDLSPWGVRTQSHQEVHLVCPDCGYEYSQEARRIHRTLHGVQKRGGLCPCCQKRVLVPGKNDLATTHPEIAKHWHPTKNGDLTPADVMANSRLQVWWMYDDGGEGKASISGKVRRGGGCTRRGAIAEGEGRATLSVTHPDLCLEWDCENNGELTPSVVTYGSQKKVFWTCPKCGNRWQATIKSRAGSGSGCPKCAIMGNSQGEGMVREALAALGLNYEVERRFHKCRYKRPLPFDFAIVSPLNDKVLFLIEYQGRQHEEAIPMWGGEDGLALRKRCDQIKRDWCKESGIPLLEVNHTLNSIEDITWAIARFIAAPEPNSKAA